MKKMRLEVELEYDDDMMHGNNSENFKWFIQEVIRGPHLILHDNEVGDTIGTIKVQTVTLIGDGWPND